MKVSPLIQAALFFQAASLVHFMWTNTTGSVVIFSAASLLAGFFYWMERFTYNDKEAFRKELQDMKDQMTHVVLSLRQL